MLARMAELRELVSFMWRQRAWWMVPPVIALLIVAVLVAVSQTAPLIYPLF